MFWYIITAPLRWLEGLFSSDQIDDIGRYRQEAGFGAWGEAGIVDGFYDPFPGVDWVVSSPFGLRTHPISGEQEFHTGIDIWFASVSGYPISPIASGIVTHAGWSQTAGNWIIIYHGDINEYIGVVSVYMHLEALLVSNNDEVFVGDIIGFAGNTGRSTNPHLHLEIRLYGWHGLDGGRASGDAVDPILFIRLPDMRNNTPDDDDLYYFYPPFQ